MEKTVVFYDGKMEILQPEELRILADMSLCRSGLWNISGIRMSVSLTEESWRGVLRGSARNEGNG